PPPSLNIITYTTLFRSLTEHDLRDENGVSGALARDACFHQGLGGSSQIDRSLIDLMQREQEQAAGIRILGGKGSQQRAINLAARSEEHTSELQSLRHLV